MKKDNVIEQNEYGLQRSLFSTKERICIILSFLWIEGYITIVDWVYTCYKLRDDYNDSSSSMNFFFYYKKSSTDGSLCFDKYIIFHINVTIESIFTFYINDFTLLAFKQCTAFLPKRNFRSMLICSKVIWAISTFSIIMI